MAYDSLPYRIRNAVKDAIGQLALPSGVDDTSVTVVHRKKISKLPGDTLPMAFVIPGAEDFRTVDETTENQVLALFTVGVVFVAEGNQSVTDNGLIDHWREKTRLALWKEDPLFGVGEVYVCQAFDPAPTFDASAWPGNYDATAMAFQFSADTERTGEPRS